MAPHNPFSKPGGGGRIAYKDYTKFIRWTPLKITIFVGSLSIVYLAVVTAIGLALGISATFPLILLALLVGLIIAAMRWLAKANL